MDDFQLTDFGVQAEETDLRVSVPLGGPVYVPNLIGALTCVPQFEASALQLLQELELELNLAMGASSVCDEDLSVDDLKIFNEEELVDKALKEAFKNDKVGESSLQPAEGEFVEGDGREEDTQELTKSSGRKRRVNGKFRKRSRGKAKEDNGVDDDADAGSSWEPEEPNLNTRVAISQEAGISHTQGEVGTSTSQTLTQASGRKRRRQRKVRKNNNDDEGYLAKVEEIAQLKRKQEEDKSAARLHSFNGSRTIKENSAPSVEKIEKLTSLRSMGTAKMTSNPHEHIPVRSPEAVLCVEVFHSIRTWSKTQEFLVLGRQTLTDLRDHIYCLTDQVMEKTGQYSPSGYFLIEDVFFNDMRDQYATDYSEPIIQWLKNSKQEAQEKWDHILAGSLMQKQKAILGHITSSKLPYYSTREMQHTRFCDLKFRLGAGYLYCHQGECQHTIVIRDMRLLHPDDVQNRAAYPILTFQLKPRFQKCAVCKIFKATKMTVDDKWAQDNPCYFCNQCYDLLHFSKDGVPLYGGFETYDYVHE
uniref:snRNA-activating protein complex subunit n=1 Tax=Kalanchoe fedtschenkoi TaxID=63787 RepID=A0A7N0UJD0_KALFE